MSGAGILAQVAPGDNSTAAYDVQRVRADFPILREAVYGRPLVYLDSAASAQKPRQVLDAMREIYETRYSNVHRGVHTLAEEATNLYEEARVRIARHIGADRREVVFTRNVTGAINLVASSWGRANVGAGDRILLTEMEHHSNIVPWYLLARQTGAELDWVPVSEDGRLDLEELGAALERRPKLLAVAHVSNVLGTINPIAEISRMAHDAGALVLVDGAQAAPKLPLDMAELGADFYAFTGHKAYGPTGIGVLWGRKELLDGMGPYEGGGSMIQKVTKEKITWASVPTRFEAGTPPIAEAVGLGAAIDWMEALGLDAIHAHETELTDYALGRLAEIPGLQVFGPPSGEDRTGIISFEVEGVHPHDVSEILDRHAVAIRAGHHCAQVLMERLGVAATTRASLAVYNTSEEIDRLVGGLLDVRRVFRLD
jgi:cysteine desulfurase/selenocysteine lyase